MDRANSVSRSRRSGAVQCRRQRLQQRRLAARRLHLSEVRAEHAAALTTKARNRFEAASMAQPERDKSITALRLDLATAKVLAWAASVGRDAELTGEAHIYFFDRYQRLADYHRRRGHQMR